MSIQNDENPVGQEQEAENQAPELGMEFQAHAIKERGLFQVGLTPHAIKERGLKK